MVSPGDIKAGGAYVDISMRTKGVERGIMKLRAKLKGLALRVGAISAGMALLAKRASRAFLDAAKLAGVQAAAEAKVAAAIKSTGGAARLTLTELKKMASALQDVTLFGDEETLNAMGQALAKFTQIGRESFEPFIKIAQDMATVLDKSLSSAVDQLGKALNDPIRGMSRLAIAGVVFTTQQEDTIKGLVKSGDLLGAQTKLLEALSVMFSGQAQAAAKTYTGRLTQLNNLVGDLKESIGNALMPQLENLLGTMFALTRAAQKWVKQNQDFIASVFKATLKITALGAAFAAVAVGLLALSSPAIVATTAFFTIGAAALSVFGKIDLGLKGLFDSFTIFGLKLENWGQSLSLAMKGIFFALLGEILDIQKGPFRLFIELLNIIARVGVKLGAFSEQFAKDWHDANVKILGDDVGFGKFLKRKVQDFADARVAFDIAAREMNRRAGIPDIADLIKDILGAKIEITPFGFPSPLGPGRAGAGAGAGAGGVGGVPVERGALGVLAGGNLLEQVGGLFGVGRQQDVQKRQLNVQQRIAQLLGAIKENTAGGGATFQ